ncbi:MAG TPA: tripartite tricarboxylate transporter substrate binding protein [Burkholderiales bacterium]|nr:tripartite tricarboxylate transporter substrate binding protein [Burkholderiales bacterium]
MSKPTCSKRLIAPVLVAATLCPAAHAADVAYPTKPIRIIIPTAPGGGSDQMVRMIGNRFTEAWGQQVVVDHRAGAGMTIGIDLTAKAAPDGYTMAVVNPSHAINATLMSKLPYDPVRDLIAVTVTSTQPYAVCVTNSLAAKNVKDVIALAKAKPGELNFASSGPGSASHLAGEMFIAMTNTQMTHIPYKGTGSAMPDLISGRAHFYINPMLAMISQINAGRIRLIAVTSPKRISTMPDVPTVSESGVPGYEATSWYMLIMPSKTPQPIVSKIHAETVKTLKSPDVVEVLAKGGSEPLANSQREAAEFLKVEIARWGKVIKQAKVKIE